MKNKEVYNRLKSELDKHNVSKKDLAKFLGVTLQQFKNKLDSKFVDIDFLEKCKEFCPEIDIEYILVGDIKVQRIEEAKSLKDQVNKQSTIIEFLMKSVKGESPNINLLFDYLNKLSRRDTAL